MSEFLKPPWIDLTGYDRGLNRQTLTVKHYATVGLKDGVGLTVSQNNAAVATVAEQSSRDGLRVFKVTGVKAGYSMLEARNNTGTVVAFMQIQVKDASGKKILVHLSTQTVQAMENGLQVYQFDCVSGDSSHATNKGSFRVIRKEHPYRSKTYDVQMNYALFFTADGKALHQYHGIMPLSLLRTMKSGTDWIGSHGCVRLSESDASALYKWAALNTVVVVD
jgi:lipoprotein-anchoring transpeptidase ErfK/SrfK